MITSYEYSLIGNMNHRVDGVSLRLQAAKAFNTAYLHGRLGQLWAKLLGKPGHLEALSGQPVTSRRPTSHIVSVPIKQIKGSLGRSEDFDWNFNPLQERSRSRWISILTAMQMGVQMPAVELVQVGDDYYVQDGHHRISVAKSLEQEAIDARIVN